MVVNIRNFFVENPEMIVAMAKGYKCKLWLDLEHKNENELKLEANIEAEEGKELTLQEFLEIHQKQIKEDIN